MELLQVLHYNEVGGVADMQQTGLQPVVPHRVDTSGAKDLEHVYPLCHRPGAEPVDMAGHQAIRVFVIAAKHHLFRPVVEQRDQGLEILCGAAFADEDVHTKSQLIQGLFGGEAFVIGADARLYVQPRLLAAQTGGMTVYRQAEMMRRRNLFHYLRVMFQHSGEIHHFAEIADVFIGKEAGDGCGIEGGSGGFEAGGGDAAGGAEVEIERNGPAVGDHEFDAGETADVGDLVRVADGRDGTMDNGHAREFRRYEERAFDVDVRVDEARKNEGEVCVGARGLRAGCIGSGGGICYGRDTADEAPFDGDLDRSDLLFDDVDQLASNLHLLNYNLPTK